MGVLQEFMVDKQDFAYVFYGPMRSGKTSKALRELKDLEENSPWSDHIITFRPLKDTRKSVQSGSGEGFESLPHFHWANSTNPYDDVLKTLKQYDVYKTKKYDRKLIVAFDEVNFFDDSLVDLVMKLSDMEIKTVLCGLELDYRRYPFSTMEMLLTIVPQRWKMQQSSCCEYDGGKKCEAPGRYTQRHILINGIWRPSSFFEATNIPEGHESLNYKYGVVCAEHHEVRETPIDAFRRQNYYRTQLHKLDAMFATGDHFIYPDYRKKLLKEAKKNGVIRK